MNIKKPLTRVWLALPTLFNVQPAADYQTVISHSAAELNAKAWARTGRGLRAAINQFERQHPHVRQHPD